MRRSMWKKSLAAVLGLSMVFVSACGQSRESSAGETKAQAVQTAAAQASETKGEAEKEVAQSQSQYPEQVTEPITIEFWHTRGSGANGDNMTAMIEEFNASNGLGITVEGVYQGSYAETLSKITAAVGAGDNPAVAIVASGGIETLADAGVLADMMPYMERDGFDLDNIPEGLQYYMTWEEGKALVVPYLVSSPILYYNKALWPEAPGTIQELYAGAEKIYAEKGVPGWGLIMDVGYLQRPVIITLGANGLLTADGLTADGLENGEMRTYLTDWQNGVKEGYIVPPEVTDASNAMQQLFYQGQVGMFGATSGNLKNVMKLSAENNVDLGIGTYVGYDGPCASIGGGSLAILESNNSQQEKAAAWEFIKFLYSDENIVRLHSETGYLPMTYSAAESQECQEFWGQYPGFKTAFDQLSFGKYNEWSVYGAEWKAKVLEAMQYVIVTQEMTPDEAVEFLKTQVSVVFP